MTATAVDLRTLDQAHLLHPQHHPADHADPLIFDRGEGALLWTVDGQRYIDGLSGLWNVNVGHGRRELADAAQRQMTDLAFTSAYVGSSNPPAIELAARVARLTGPTLNTIFFTTGGAESNETAFKAAWFFWSMQGKPEKRKILSRSLGYHGVTMGAGSATGLPVFWKHFGPQPPGFSHIPNLDPDALEAQIVAEGPDTVAAFIGEPVQGAGGVIPPPADYWPRVRDICSKYDVLLIADEVITGFGRTGRWFALEHWGVEADMVSFAKGITSGYIPLGGVIISDRIRQVLYEQPATTKFMHAFTYSGHATCCAVGLANLDILEGEGLVERAAALGERLQAGLAPLADHPAVKEVRGLGMMAAVEFQPGVAAPAGQLGAKVIRACRQRGLFTRFREDIVMLAPPLVIRESELDEVTTTLREAVTEVAG